MADVWVLGSLNVDVVVRVPRHPEPGETLIGGDPALAFGGKGANQAVAAARAGAAVRMIGAVGEDAEGAAYRERLARFGVDVRGVRRVPGPTGRAFIAVADDGENTIIVSPGANAAVGGQDLDALRGIVAGDVLLLQLEVDLDVVAAAARTAAAAGARVVLNTAPYADLPADVLALAEPVVANASEAELLRAAGGRPAELLVTRGEEGSAWGGIAVPADRAGTVVDTTGAGDTYCGALAAALAAGEDREPAMRAAAAAAARSVEHAGAQPEPDDR
ncbi:PfkB family carbohydrate kinase [Amnibacterium setariae]|uniref:Ribokinase n=1 Tax=Amnibacterium setariae TaxID=2306585 RepID=A0A3A1TWL9_9MICO|nr:PfkB family carbohydrate kinase [Amnibacterium setariae]RIX26538.1 ribokinase [Amnibacterium setariae]